MLEEKRRFVVDIDDTLLIYPDSHLPDYERKGAERYCDAMPNIEQIKKLNKLYEQGHPVIINTGRGWDQLEITQEQLKKFGIKYTGLVMGRPLGTFIDVDSLKEVPEC